MIHAPCDGLAFLVMCRTNEADLMLTAFLAHTGAPSVGKSMNGSDSDAITVLG